MAVPQKPEWIQRSDLVLSDPPEDGSSQGLSQYDTEVSCPPMPTNCLVARVEQALVGEKDTRVAQDLRILGESAQQTLDDQEFYEKSWVPFNNPTGAIYAGLTTLLDHQNRLSAGRQPPLASANTLEWKRAIGP